MKWTKVGRCRVVRWPLGFLSVEGHLGWCLLPSLGYCVVASGPPLTLFSCSARIMQCPLLTSQLLSGWVSVHLHAVVDDVRAIIFLLLCHHSSLTLCRVWLTLSHVCNEQNSMNLGILRLGGGRSIWTLGFGGQARRNSKVATSVP